MERHVHSFNKVASKYDRAAELQNYVAARLAENIDGSRPLRSGQTVLEIGCGTGLLTRHLPRVFGDAATFIITDAAPNMVADCKSAFKHAALDLRFDVMDGQKLTLPPHSVDRIVTSMTAQWFDDPVKSLTDMQPLLKPGGMVTYAAVGCDNFTEWREHLEHLGLDFGGRPLPEEWPGAFREEFIERDYKSATGFLKMLAATGAGTPKPGYKTPSNAEWGKAVKGFDGRVTWHIVYGRLPALTV